MSRVSRGSRLLSAGALATIAACCLAVGCTSTGAAPGSPFPTEPAGPVTVTILSGADTSIPPPGTHESGMYSELVAWWNRYEQRRTGIHLVLDTVPGGATAEHSEMLADAEHRDSAYDIYNLDNEWVPEFAAGNFIWSLQGRLPTNGFLAQPLASGSYNGQLYAAPFTTDVGLLYYRKDFVTWSQVTGLTSFDGPNGLVPLARQVMATHPSLTIGYVGQFASYEGLTVNLLEIAHGDDPAMFADNGTISGPGGFTQALTELLGAMTDTATGVIPSELGYEESQAVSAFAKGKALFMRNWPIYYEQLVTAKGEGSSQVANNVRVVPLPFPSVLGGQDLAIAKASPHPAAALQVVKYLTSESAERCLFAIGGFPATRGIAYADDGSLPTGYSPINQPLCGTQAGPEVSIGPVIKKAIKDAFLRPRTPYYTEFSSIIQDEVHHQLAGSNPTNDISGFAAGLTTALNDAAATGQAPPRPSPS